MKPLLKEKAAADCLGMSVDTMRKWRSDGGGPQYTKLGPKSVRYRPEDLEKFIADRMFLSTSHEKASQESANVDV